MKVKAKCRLCGHIQVKEVSDVKLIGRDYCNNCLTVSQWGSTPESRKPALEIIEILEEPK